MPKNSIPNFIVTGENLLNTVRSSAAEVPGIALHTVPFEGVLTEAKAITSRLDTHKGVKQEESQVRREIIKRGRQLMARIQAALKAHYGLQSERLVEFGIKPIRPRKKAAKEPKPAPQTPVPAPQPTPEIQSK